MRPHKAYNLNFGKKSKTNHFLIIFLFVQFSLYTISHFKIQVPELVINYGINYFGKSQNIQINSLEYKFPNKFFIKKAILSSKNGHSKFKNINFNLDSFFSKLKIDNLRIEEISILYPNNELTISDIIGYKRNNNIITQFNVNNQFCDLNFFGILNVKKLININSSSSKEFNYKNLTISIDNIKKYISNKIFMQKPMFLIFLSMKNQLVLNIKQVNKESSNTFVNGLSGIFQLNENNLHISNVNVKANNISIANTSNLIRANDINFSYQHSNISQNSLLKDEIKLSIQNIITSGKFNGIIPPLMLKSHYKNEKRYINFFSSSNSTSFSNNIVLDQSKIKRITGFNLIIPSELNLKIKSYGSSYNFLKGESLIINLYNKEIIPSSTITHIKVKALNFSVLDTPLADYNASGSLNNGLSLIFNNVTCTMGHSNVQGSYTQDWNPYNYEFILDGSLLPTNINNWFGNWWDKIWLDFKFDETIPPIGNFIISGDWQDASIHSTYGFISSKNLTYKNFFIDHSNLQISVDQNSTLLENIYLNHPTGNLSGSVSILKNKEFKHNNFNYLLQGILPINATKKVFGPVIETFLDDLNLSSVSISSKGQIPIKFNENNNTDSSNNYFTIDLFTEQSGSWNDIKFSGLKGNITSDLKTTEFKFPFIGFSDGRLSVNLAINNMNKLVSLSFELINANIKNLYFSFLNFQNRIGQKSFVSSNSNIITNKGTLDLKLNASGSYEDFSNFKGSGKITAYDKDLSKLQLLGFLSKGLSEIPIPLPTGTLNFNKLEGLFELENDKLMFDQIVLSGLFSKIENRGSFNFINGELDIISKIQLIGNLPIPLVKQFAQFADPLSTFAEIKVTGPWSDPQWKLSIKPLE